MTIALIDSGICNLASVMRALDRVGVPVRTVSDAAGLGGAAAIILPGVGAFGDGMASLREKGLVEPLQMAARTGVPLLGICLGMQLLAEESEEHGCHPGLGLVPGRVRRLEADRPGYRVPNIGWCDATAPRPGILFPVSYRPQSFYFVHSYHLETPVPDVVAATIAFSGRPVVAAIEAGTVFGAQFHPEKSQDAGLDLLGNFAAHLRRLGRLA